MKHGTSDKATKANELELRRQGHNPTQAREIAEAQRRQAVNKPRPSGAKPQYSR